MGQKFSSKNGRKSKSIALLYGHCWAKIRGFENTFFSSKIVNNSYQIPPKESLGGKPSVSIILGPIWDKKFSSKTGRKSKSIALPNGRNWAKSGVLKTRLFSSKIVNNSYQMPPKEPLGGK